MSIIFLSRLEISELQFSEININIRFCTHFLKNTEQRVVNITVVNITVKKKLYSSTELHNQHNALLYHVFFFLGTRQSVFETKLCLSLPPVFSSCMTRF